MIGWRKTKPVVSKMPAPASRTTRSGNAASNSDPWARQQPHSLRPGLLSQLGKQSCRANSVDAFDDRQGGMNRRNWIK
jgi:hypothetical protein